MTSSTAAGSSLAISAANPATLDASGYAAITYTEVSQIEKIGSVGAVYAKVEFQPFVGAKQKYKGAVDYGALQPSLAHDESDAGQSLIRSAADDVTTKLYSFLVTYPTGAKRYFQGRVFGYPENTDGADTILMAAPTVEICTAIVKVAPVTPLSPVNTVPPAIAPTTGDVGTVFTLSNGTWTNSPTFARQWYNAAGLISGATGSTYSAAAGDRAGSIYGVVTGTANGVPVTASSNSVAIPAGSSATAPAAPSITLIPGDGQVSVAWTDGSNGGAAITSHKLYAGPSSGTLALIATITTASPYVETGRANGTQRFYALTAVNSVNEGPPSATASATPAAAPAPGTSVPVGSLPSYQIVLSRSGDPRSASLFALKA